MEELIKLALSYGDSAAVLIGAVVINRIMINNLEKKHEEEKQTNKSFRETMYKKERDLLKCNGEIKTSIAVIEERQKSQDEKMDSIQSTSDKILEKLSENKTAK